MSLLAKLAPHVGGYKETIGTEALGVLLTNPAAGRAVTAALRVALPELPETLRFVTQSGSDDTRPDVVGLHGDREVLHIEGKFWAGLTDAQARNRYLLRLAQEHELRDPSDPCRGALLWVCPPRRAADLWSTVLRVSDAQQIGVSATSGWRYARTSTGQGLSLIDWQYLCDVLEHAGEPALAEDVRQLRGFTDEVDRNAFLPWSVEQLTDQAASRRHIELVQLLKDIRHRGQRQGVLTKKGRNATASTEGATGVVIYLGEVWTAFMVSSELHAARLADPDLPRGERLELEEVRDRRLEQELVDAYIVWRGRGGATVLTQQHGIRGLSADIFLPAERLIIEAKAHEDATTVAHAIGQARLYQYAANLESRCVDRIAVLLPKKPGELALGYARTEGGVTVIWRDGAAFAQEVLV